MATFIEIIGNAFKKTTTDITNPYASLVDGAQGMAQVVADQYVSLVEKTKSVGETAAKFNALSEDDRKTVLDYVGKNRNANINFDTLNALKGTGISIDGAVALANETIVAPATATAVIQAGEAAARTRADREQTGKDSKQTGIDASHTAADAEQTRADREQTGKDVAQTGKDSKQTSIDASHTAADTEQTRADREQTGKDVAQTGKDAKKTGEDREQTGRDLRDTKTAEAGSKLAAFIAGMFAGKSAESAAQSETSATDSRIAKRGAVTAEAGSRLYASQSNEAAGRSQGSADAAKGSELAADATLQTQRRENVDLKNQIGALRKAAQDLETATRTLSGLDTKLLDEKTSVDYRQILEYANKKREGVNKAHVLCHGYDGHSATHLSIEGNGVFFVPKPGQNLTISSMDKADIVGLNVSNLNKNQVITVKNRKPQDPNVGRGQVMLLAKEGDNIAAKESKDGVVLTLGGKTITVNGATQDDIILATVNDAGQVNKKVVSLRTMLSVQEADHQKKMDEALKEYNKQRSATLAAADTDASSLISPREAEVALRKIKDNDDRDHGRFNTDVPGPVSKILKQIQVGNQTVEVTEAQARLNEAVAAQSTPKASPIAPKKGGPVAGH